MKEDVTRESDVTAVQGLAMWGCVLGGMALIGGIGFLLYLTHGWSW